MFTGYEISLSFFCEKFAMAHVEVRGNFIPCMKRKAIIIGHVDQTAEILTSPSIFLPF